MSTHPAPKTIDTLEADAAPDKSATGRIVLLLAAGVFTMVTSELMAGGLLSAISNSLTISLGAASLLISGFASGQMLGPWLLGLPLARMRPRTVLTSLLVGFAVFQIAGIFSPWPMMLLTRILSGMTMAAFFTIAMNAVTRIVPGRQQPRALAAVFNGATVGTTLGLPLATFAGSNMTWRDAFLLDSALALLVAIAMRFVFPSISGTPPVSAGAMLSPLKNRKVWRIFAVSALSMGGTLLAFAFLNTALQQVTGIPSSITPWLLGLFGLANIVGMTVVGRVTPSGPTRVIAWGLIISLAALLLLLFFLGSTAVSVAAIALLGLSGTSINPAITERVMRVAGGEPAVLAMMPTIMTGGVLMATLLGGAIVNSPMGLNGPFIIGAGFMIVALLLLLPDSGDLRAGNRSL